MRAVADVTKALVVRGGRVRVPIGCTGTAATRCAGAVRLDAALPRSKRFTTLARARFGVPAGHRGVVVLRVRKHLPRGRALHARLVLGATTRSVVLRVR
jgi:ribosomal protein L15E